MNKNPSLKFTLSLIFIITICNLCNYISRRIESKKESISSYEVYNFYPSKNSKTRSYLYLASSGKKKFLLRAHNRKKFFRKYKSLLYTTDKNSFFYIEDTLIEESRPAGLNKIRQYIYNWINRKHTYNGINDIKHYIQTIILGIREDKSHNFHLFKATGTWHLLCVGGLHMNLLKRFILLIVSLFFLQKPNKVYPFFYYIQMIVLSLYGYISGFHIPALRSVLMNNCDLFARIRGFYINLFYRYIFSFCGILCWNRLLIYDFGFQMSFLAIYVIIVYAPYGKKVIETGIRNKYFIIVYENLYINILITFAVSLHSFLLHGSLNVFSPLINMMAIPVFTFGVLGFFLHHLPVLNIVFTPLTIYSFKLLEWILFIGERYGVHIYWKIQKKKFNFYLCLFVLFFFLLELILFLKKRKTEEQNTTIVPM